MFLYMVQSDDGKYLRSTGFGGHGKHWVNKMEEGKIWVKKGVALAQITRWKNMYPDIPTAKLVILSASIFEVENQEERVDLAIKKLKIKEAERKIKSIEWKSLLYGEDKRKLEEDIKKLKEELELLRTKV